MAMVVAPNRHRWLLSSLFSTLHRLESPRTHFATLIMLPQTRTPPLQIVRRRAASRQHLPAPTDLHMGQGMARAAFRAQLGQPRTETTSVRRAQTFNHAGPLKAGLGPATSCTWQSLPATIAMHRCQLWAKRRLIGLLTAFLHPASSPSSLRLLACVTTTGRIKNFKSRPSKIAAVTRSCSKTKLLLSMLSMQSGQTISC